MMYGNSSNGFSYSPDRSYDVDRFNPSTRGNYTTEYNPYGYYSPTGKSNYQTSASKKGHYTGSGQWVND